MTHTKLLVVLLAALWCMGAGCFCLQQKDKEVETHEAFTVLHHAEATADALASAATGTATGTASALTSASAEKSPAPPSSVVVSGVKDLPTFFSKYNAALTDKEVGKSVLFFCSIREDTKCHYKASNQAMLGIITCGDESTMAESHPNKFWTQERYCAHEVKKGKECPTDKTKLLSGVDGLIAVFGSPTGIIMYDPEDDKRRKARTMYFYCRQTGGREMSVRLDLNGGKASAYRATGAVLGASLLAVLVTIVGGSW